jgi:uncharacterized protein YqgV (UPF0045/DUF77 family)
MPDWLIPSALTLVSALLGAYIGASRKLTVIEGKVDQLMNWMKHAEMKLSSHNEDILVHDIEIQSLCDKTDTPRAQRQILRRHSEG